MLCNICISDFRIREHISTAFLCTPWARTSSTSFACPPTRSSCVSRTQGLMGTKKAAVGDSANPFFGLRHDFFKLKHLKISCQAIKMFLLFKPMISFNFMHFFWPATCLSIRWVGPPPLVGVPSVLRKVPLQSPKLSNATLPPRPIAGSDGPSARAQRSTWPPSSFLIPLPSRRRIKPSTVD